MTASLRPWNAAEAKVNFGTLLDRAEAQPQMILKRGRPAAVLISYDTWKRAEGAFATPLARMLDELNDLHRREGDFELPPRMDRPAVDLE